MMTNLETRSKKTSMSNVLRVSILMLITALLVAPTSALFAQGISTQIFLPVATNMSATEQSIELDVEGMEAQLASLGTNEDELSALGGDLGCLNPFYWGSYQYFQPVQWGNRGTNVQWAQWYLINRHNRSLAPWGMDGDFGRTTYDAVREVQQYWKNQGYTACGYTIQTNGVVNAQTWAILAFHRTPPQGSSTGGGTRAQLAQQILNSNRISLADYHTSGRVDNATAYLEMVDTAAGGRATLSAYGNAPGGSVYLGTDFLQHMLTLANSYTYFVTEFAGGSHSATSYHYSGKTVDVGIINGQTVGWSHPDLESFKQACRNLGAIEVLGPGYPGHDHHIHCSWGR